MWYFFCLNLAYSPEFDVNLRQMIKFIFYSLIAFHMYVCTDHRHILIDMYFGFCKQCSYKYTGVGIILIHCAHVFLVHNL